jgi:hypothetical protein
MRDPVDLKTLPRERQLDASARARRAFGDDQGRRGDTRRAVAGEK